MALTLRNISLLKLKTSRYVVWDGGLSGFGLRVTPNGERTYVLKYRTEDGRQRWYTIGRHGSPWTPELARKEAQRLLGTIAAGGEPGGPNTGKHGTINPANISGTYFFS